MSIFVTVQNNTDPTYTLNLVRADDSVIDLTDASRVDLYIKNRDTNATTNGSNTQCTISSAAGGIVTYAPQSGDFPDVAVYVGQIKITRNSGKVERLADLVQFPVYPKFD